APRVRPGAAGHGTRPRPGERGQGWCTGQRGGRRRAGRRGGADPAGQPRRSYGDSLMAMSTVDVPAAEIPALVMDLELSGPLPYLPTVDGQGRQYRQAWLLVRMFTEPLGLMVLHLPEDGIGPIALAKAV